MSSSEVREALDLLDLHYESFYAANSYATRTGHPVPTDTRGWSQILVSVLCRVKGLGRKKGPDLVDGSDVKGANTWEAIDTPRFNGVIKAGTLSNTSGTMSSLDAMPYIYLVLWDDTIRNSARCRIWVVRPQNDCAFRSVCRKWYEQRSEGLIKSNNFQLHPPRGKDANLIRNNCGSLLYPLYFLAERTESSKYKLLHYDPRARAAGECTIP